MTSRWLATFILVAILSGLLLTACAPAPAAAPTSTPAPPTATPVPPTDTPTPEPTATPEPSPTPTPLPTLQAGGQTIAYRIAGDQLTLVTGDASQTLDFPQPVTAVDAAGKEIKVALADGSQKTLAYNPETAQWEEKKLRKYADVKEVDLHDAENITQVKNALDKYLAGSVFLSNEEAIAALEKMGLGLYEYNGEVIIATQEVVNTINEDYYGDFSYSPWAMILNVNGSVWSWFFSNQYENSPKAQAIAGFDKAGNPIIYVFLTKFDGDQIAIQTMSMGDNEQVLSPYTSSYRGFGVRWDEATHKLVLVDEYETATHEWDDQKKEWVELEEYRVYGTPAERMAYALEYKLNEVRRVDSKNHTNVLGLDEAEVAQARAGLLAGEPVDEINGGLTSFYILTDAEGEPQMVAVVGGEYGVTKAQLANLKEAVAGIETVDPGILAFLSNQFGAKFISARTSFANVDNNRGIFSSNDGVDTIIAKQGSVKTVADFIFVLLVESGEINGSRHMINNGKDWVVVGNLSEYKNFGHFAMVNALEWLDSYGVDLVKSDTITQQELDNIVNLAKYGLEQYTK